MARAIRTGGSSPDRPKRFPVGQQTRRHCHPSKNNSRTEERDWIEPIDVEQHLLQDL
jgi:hypothetical protein